MTPITISTLLSLSFTELLIVLASLLIVVWTIRWIVTPLWTLLFAPLSKVVNLENKEDCKNRRFKRIGNVPPVYPNGWFKVCDSRELRRGQVIFKHMCGLQLAVFRSQDSDKVSIIDAYCTHLGANLAIGGTVNGDCLTCPFHHWSFNGEGKCISTGAKPLEMPILNKKGKPKNGLAVGNSVTDEPIPKQAHTKAYCVEEKNDMIYLWYDAEDREPHWFVPDIQSGKGRFTHGKITHEIFCHIQEIPENGPDMYHLNIVHRDMEKRSIIRNIWGATWKKGESKEDSHQSYFNVQHIWTFLDLFNIPLSFVDVNGSQHGPGVVTFEFNIVLGNFAMVQTVTPVGPFHQVCEHVAYVPWYFPRGIAKLFIILMTSLLEQDIPIWNNKLYRDNPCLIKSDGPIMQFRRWFSQFYSDNSPTIRTISERSLDW